MSEKISNLDSGIRVIHFFRRIGSIAVVGIIFLVLLSETYHQIKNRFPLSDLKDISNDGIYKLADVNNEYEVEYINNKPRLTLKYSFKHNNKTYENEYVLYHHLPEDVDTLKKIFTVHYLNDNPNKNSLNIENEIKRIEKSIEESSIFWLIIKIIGSIIFGFILLFQILSFISEIKDFDKPIEIPEYHKK